MKSVRVRPLRRRDSRAVSEVVGSVILLVITVSAFAVLFVLVQGVPKPAPGVAADLQATLERTGPTSANVLINHLGGEDLVEGETFVVISVNATVLTYNLSQGLGGETVFSLGRQWRMGLPIPVSPDTRVVVTVVSRVDNSILYNAELQAGYQAGAAGYPPIIALAYAQSQAGSAQVANNGVQTVRLHAVVIDPDGNLDGSSGVWGDITVVPAGPNFQVTAIGLGRFNLTRTEGSHFQTPDLTLSANVPPGNYTVVVHAQDAAGGNATASLPLTVTSLASGSGPTLTVAGYSIAPISANTSATDVGVLRLNVSSSGGDTSVSQIVVQKAGTLGDNQITVAAWIDANNDGAFSANDDLQVTTETGFVTGTANIFAVPITTAPSGGTRVLFIVASLVGADDGTNVTLSLSGTSSVRGTGVPGGVPATTSGWFPIASTDIVVGSKFSLEYESGAPDRMLVNSKNVRFLELSVKAAGEPFNVKKINVTLIGTIPRSSASCYVTINGQMISSAKNFDSSRTASFSVNFPVSDAAGWVPMGVFLNMSGSTSHTVGIQITTVTDTFAQGQVSLKGRNGQSSTLFPISSGVIGLSSAGNLSVDEWNETALVTSVRAGMNSVYLHTFKVRAHGENIDFNKFEMAQTGNLTDAQFLAVTLRVRGGPWLSGTFFAGKVTWDAGVIGKLFAITINATNSGNAVFDVYANLTTGVQAKEFSLFVNDNTKVRGYGKTSLSTMYANAESAPYPISLGVRRIQGDVSFWGTNLAPISILAPANLVPVLKLTAKPIGENMTIDEVFVRSVQGVPAAGSATVHLYRDANNDTTTTVQGDDSEIAAAEAGSFGSDAFKAFAPAVSITVGSDYNFFLAIDFTTAAAGFSLEMRVNASNITVRGLYSLSTIPPNTQAGVANPPELIYQTPPVMVYDRGTLSIAATNLNSQGYVNTDVVTKMLRLTVSAAVENVNIDSVRLHQLGNVSGGEVDVALWWDVNEDGEVNSGDIQLGLSNFLSGDVTFTGTPLLTVSAGQTEHLIVRIQVDEFLAGNTVGVELTNAGFISATGVTTSLGITPTASFPLASPAVPLL